MIFVVNLTSQKSNYDQVQTFDGTEYELRLLWNERDEHWYMTLSDTEGNAIATGRKLVSGPWAERDTLDTMPPGQLWVQPTEGSDDDPRLRDLNVRVYLMYVDEDSNQ